MLRLGTQGLSTRETCFYRIWFKSIGYFLSCKKAKKKIERKTGKKKEKNWKKKEKAEVCGFTLGFFMVLKNAKLALT